jgi:hypothetical protein
MRAPLQKIEASPHQGSRRAARNDSPTQLLDNRPEAQRLRQLKEIADMQRQRQPVDSQELVQRAAEEEEPADAVAQHKSISQLAAQETSSSTAGHDVAARHDNGLPSQLKAGIESLSGMNMGHVKVHYNSSQPAQLNAHAYAQGSDIHVAPGQEQHLPHEAWHVVQQAQGRVQATAQMKTGVAINDDKGLEHEADVMGAKAFGAGQLMQQKSMEPPHPFPTTSARDSGPALVQAKSIVRNTGQPFAWGGTSTIVGKKMEAWLDPNDPVQGESANINADQNPMMAAIRTHYGINGGDLVKGHLLNDNLGGKALNNNLFPITRAANKQHLITTENYAKAQLWTHNSPIWYSIEVQQPADINQSTHQFDVKLGNWDMATDTAHPAAITGSVFSDLGSPKDADIANAHHLANYSAGTLANAVGMGRAVRPHTTVGGMSADEQNYRDHSGALHNTEHEADAYISGS